VSGQKLMRTLGFEPKVTLEESVEHMAREIERFGYTDFSHPRYYNIEWMKLLEESVEIVSGHGYVLSKPSVTIDLPDGEVMAAATSGRGHQIG
jgi:hypothetical protein